MKDFSFLFRIVCLTAILTGCRTFPDYTDGAMQYDSLVYGSDWRFIVVPKEAERNLPPAERLFPSLPEYERLFRQAEVLPLLKERLLNGKTPMTAADFLLECDSLINELSRIDPVRDFRCTSGVKKAPQIYETRDRLIRQLREFRKTLENPAI